MAGASDAVLCDASCKPMRRMANGYDYGRVCRIVWFALTDKRQKLVATQSP